MSLKVHPGVVPLGNGCYVVAAFVQAIYPWGEGEEVDAVLPGHGTSTAKSVVVLRNGVKLAVRLKTDTVLDRYLKATRWRAGGAT
jgi:hypothetical protein